MDEQTIERLRAVVPRYVSWGDGGADCEIDLLRVDLPAWLICGYLLHLFRRREGTALAYVECGQDVHGRIEWGVRTAGACGYDECGTGPTELLALLDALEKAP